MSMFAAPWSGSYNKLNWPYALTRLHASSKQQRARPVAAPGPRASIAGAPSACCSCARPRRLSVCADGRCLKLRAVMKQAARSQTPGGPRLTAFQKALRRKRGAVETWLGVAGGQIVTWYMIK